MEASKRKQLQALERFEHYGLLTPQGKNWLIAATDPFHDTGIDLAGYPDMNVADSVVQCVQKTLNLSCPSGITTGTWDCHIVNWPLAASTIGQPVNLYNGSLIAGGGTWAQFYMGGCTALGVATGNQGYFSSNSGGAGGIYNIGQLEVDHGGGTDGYMTGASRIIGMGFEVVNTTAALYKQGQVISYRQPLNYPSDIRGYTYQNATGTSTQPGPFPMWKITTPPTTPAQAMLLTGSRQWGAEDGCYCVSTMSTLENPCKVPQPFLPLCIEEESEIREIGTAAAMVANMQTQTLGSATINYPVTNTPGPFNMSGAYFTGLSLQTTLSLTVTWYVERFPSPLDTQLVVLASPSPGFDQFAYELYTAAMRDMPAGVKVSENPLGEWFRSVVNEIASNAAPVLQHLAPLHPGFGIAGQLAGVISEATKQPKAQKIKKVKQNKPMGPAPLVLAPSRKSAPSSIPRRNYPASSPGFRGDQRPSRKKRKGRVTVRLDDVD